MAWGSWREAKNRRTDSGGLSNQLDRPSDEQILANVAERLIAVSGRPWHVEAGHVAGPGHTTVVFGAPHPGDLGDRHDGHLDLTFILDTSQPIDTAIVDCVVGLGETPEDKVRRAVDVWATTTATTVLELLEQRGDHATYLSPDAPNGVAGWHTIHGRVIGWGNKDHHDTLQNWAIEHALLPALAPALTDTPFERDDLIGVKIFFGSHGDHEAAEVRVNGKVHTSASEALQGLDWPRIRTGASYARTFVLLVEPASR